jgi:CheY-like chemotaxis protein
MVDSQKKKIIIVEDAKGVAHGYKSILEVAGYDVTVCLTGKEAQGLIDREEKFDLAIVDVMLPPEDLDKYTLNDALDTGLRLIAQMIKNGICHRFYAITVRGDVGSELEEICSKSSAYIYEDKIDYQPENLLDRVQELLSKDIPDGDCEESK